MKYCNDCYYSMQNCHDMSIGCEIEGNASTCGDFEYYIHLKGCPFCGGDAKIYGREVKDFVNGEWAEGSRKEYYVQAFHKMTCLYGNTHARAFGVVGGISYKTPEAAAKAWNKRQGGVKDEV